MNAKTPAIDLNTCTEDEWTAHFHNLASAGVTANADHLAAAYGQPVSAEHRAAFLDIARQCRTATVDTLAAIFQNTAGDADTVSP